MTELTMSLLIAGCSVVVGVIAYNYWQEYKARKRVERAFGDGQDDVLMQTEPVPVSDSSHRQEPSLHNPVPHHTPVAVADSEVLATAVGEQSTEMAIHPVEETDSVAPVAAQAETAAELPPELPAPVLPVDEFIDCIIPMEFDQPVRGDKILAEIQSLRRVGNKPVHFFGQSQQGIRDVIMHAGSYTHLFAGVQLVSRSGALNEVEYSELLSKLRQIADNLSAHPDIPNMQHVMDAGRDLYQFVAEHDAKLSVNVHTNDAPWAISTLLLVLEKQGFELRPDGHMVMLDKDGGALFTLSTNSSVTEQVASRLTLLLDVPCVPSERDAFNVMVSCAKSLALRLGGTLVDDGNQVLNEATLHEIEQQVALFYNSMQAADIPAGSIRARRLFS